MAVLDARLAGRDAGAEALLSDRALVTGFDIIFFWVARMMMMGLHFMKEVPFHDVYIHALVRDASGAKMSKSKGNVIDPLGIIDDYGADALRFTLARHGARRAATSSSRRSDVEGYRNFATKLWNAARFAEMNGCGRVAGFDPKIGERNAQPLDRARNFATRCGMIELRSTTYRFNDAAASLYRFVWNIYCDWYLELAKPILLGADGDATKRETQAIVAWVRDEILSCCTRSCRSSPKSCGQVTRRLRRAMRLLALTEWPQAWSLRCRRPKRRSAG